MSGLAMAAFAVRWPAYRDYPRFRDETGQALVALSIARGESLPLTDVEPYISPLFDYGLALLFRLLGEHPFLPRLVVLACGVLTVLVTGLFARDLVAASRQCGSRGRRLVAGLAAAALLATNPLHVVVNSHVAWAHAATPLFTTLGLWLVWRAVELHERAALAEAGAALGVACGTHPTAGLLLPGVAAYVILRGRWVFTSPWAWLGVALAVLVNAPLVIFNLQNGFGSIGGAKHVLSEYGHGRLAPGEPAAYLRYLGRQLLLLEQLIAGPLDLRPAVPVGALDPVLLLYAVVTLFGLVLLTRSGSGLLLPLCAVPVVLGLAYLNTSKYEPVPDGRYLAPLLPLAAIASAAAASFVLGRGASPARLAGCLAVGAFLVLQPLLHLGSYYARAAHEMPTNERLVRTVAEIADARQPSEPVLLDARLNTVTFRTGGADEEAASYRGLRYLLTVAKVPFEVVELDATTLEARRQASPRSLVILSSATAMSMNQVPPSRLGLRGLDGRPAELPPPAAYFGLFRLEARP